MKTHFLPSQIVSLDYQDSCLYGEVVQVISKRELCWVRPLILAKKSLETEVVDVRLTSDLIFPINLFRPALDVEVIPILTHLEKMDLTAEKLQTAKSELQDFIKQFWNEN